MTNRIVDPLAEEAGIIAAHTIFNNEFKWGFRRQTVLDWGIDAHVEIVERDEPTGKLFALQIKSGPSYFRRQSSGDYTFYGEARHLRYWTNHFLPVFIIIHNPETGETLWEKFERANVRTGKKGRWSMTIPAANILSAQFKSRFEDGIPSGEPAARRFMMTVDYPIIAECVRQEEHGTLRMQVDQFFKSINMRNARIYFPKNWPGLADLKFDRWMVHSDLNEFMAFRFPWLDYEYEEPLEDGSGEGVTHHLFVEVNALGKAVLVYEDYLANDVEEKDIQPPEGEPELTDDELDELHFQHAIRKD